MFSKISNSLYARVESFHTIQVSKISRANNTNGKLPSKTYAILGDGKFVLKEFMDRDSAEKELREMIKKINNKTITGGIYASNEMSGNN